MSAIVQIEPRTEGRSLTAGAVREHVNLIQEVMRLVMKEGTHYGVIPGCDKPSLYKAGSEVLLTTFRIAVDPQVEDLSTADCFRYRVKTVGTHQQSGVIVGAGIGECSSDETKYKWRRCYIQKEFDETPESRRRIKYSSPKGSNKVFENMEVRVDPADVANTILKMSKKRAQIDMTLTALAASDIFTQDIEDMPEELQERPEPTADEIAAARKAQHDAALDRHKESIEFIKDRLAKEDWKSASEEWAAIPTPDQMALWLAPTKGGYLTTLERQQLRDHPAAKSEETV